MQPSSCPTRCSRQGGLPAAALDFRECLCDRRGSRGRAESARAHLRPGMTYVNVRQLFLIVKESIDEGTYWVVFEPNDEPLRAGVSRW